MQVRTCHRAAGENHRAGKEPTRDHPSTVLALTFAVVKTSPAWKTAVLGRKGRGRGWGVARGGLLGLFVSGMEHRYDRTSHYSELWTVWFPLTRGPSKALSSLPRVDGPPSRQDHSRFLNRAENFRLS